MYICKGLPVLELQRQYNLLELSAMLQDTVEVLLVLLALLAFRLQFLLLLQLLGDACFPQPLALGTLVSFNVDGSF